MVNIVWFMCQEEILLVTYNILGSRIMLKIIWSYWYVLKLLFLIIIYF